jgi:hypothetical protein
MKMGCAAKKGRRGIAGVVAVVIIFAILFSVGTSYMIFENAQNASYVSNLTAATNKLQGLRTETLSITTFLEGDGDIGFSVNNTSSETVNMTAALVISSTGTLLECDGVGFPAGAGCGNTTPALWATVDASAGSKAYDTGYLYGAGTTDTVKLLTARGNSFSETYPEPASATGSTQSVTVNLDNLKWVQLLPQSSSLTQKKYVANCNAANCAASYSSSVTAGNILVDAISWPNQSPPSGVPTDTLHDSFTLGASSSVVVPSSAALVQNKYTSNCNAASCGLAFTSSVTSGNTLVYSLGWANQSPPSAPTDTRGDSFTLGASQSVTVNPNAPAVVQQRYVADCGSATCALAYSSSVTAGNTLVFGLGWPSTQQNTYVPVVITNNQASATPNPFQQLVTWNPSTYSTYEASDLGNIRFCADTACVTSLDAWLESCTNSCAPSATSASAWVKLTSAIAGSGGTLTIYMVFLSTSTEFDANYWGEAPTLSGTYGQYDNGANVFSDYGAFQGSSLPSGWSVSGVASFVGGTSNTGGVRLTSNSGNQYGVATSSKSFSTVGACFETSAEYNGAADDIGQGFYSSGAGTATGGYGPGTTNGNGYYASYEYYSGSKPALRQSTTTLASDGSQTMPTSGTNFLFMETCSSSGQITMQYVTNTSSQYASGVYSGLTTALTYTATISAGASTSFLGAATGGSQSYTYIFWDRIRMNPPGGVMPSTSLGSLTSGSGVPTLSDTLGDSFTLGASQSVTTSASTPSVVQHKYVSNCNSSSCGLAYSSSVTAGNTLVFGLGWSNQNPPSTPTDTRGDSFALGVSNSVQSGSSGSLALDGSTTAGSGGSATNSQTTGTLTTSHANDVIIVIASLSDGNGGSTSSNTVSSVTATGLTFHLRQSVTNYVNPDYYADVEEWYAIASSTFSNTITVQTTASDRFTVIAYGISGANTASPFDSNANANPTASGTSNAPSVTQSTSNANDMLITGLAVTQTPGTVSTFPSGYTNVADVQTAGSGSQAEGVSDYVVSSTQSNAAVSYSLSSSSNSWAMLADAIQASGNTYYSYVWYATAGSSGSDTITAAFGQTVAGSVSLYELSGVIPSRTSTGSSSAGSNTASVTSFTPASNSIVIGNAEVASSVTFSNGGSYTLVGTCTSVYGCSEYASGWSGATTVPINLGTSPPWVEAAMAFAPAVPTYYSYIWYATAASSGADTITATFGNVVIGSVSIYEIGGYSTAGTFSSTGSSSAGSTSASVGSFTPSSNSFVVGNVETGSSSTKYTVGAGYTTVASGSGGCDASDASQGCNEYETGLGSATTTPFTLSGSTPWVEAALSFAPLGSTTYYSYIWYATAASSGADTISASFGSTVAGSVSIYEINGVSTTGLLSQTGSSSSSQGATAVTSMTPSSGSVVVGNAETTSTTYTAGSGYTLSGSCSTVLGCGEYQTGVGSATTVPFSVSPSAPWVEAAVAFAPTTTSYYSYIWYATAGSSGADTITTAFGATVSGSVSLYEITGYTTSGALSSTGSSSSGSTVAAVTSFTPASDSFILGTTEGVSGSTTYTAGSGFALGGTCNSVEGCSEYDAGGGGSATTVPITLSGSTPWVEAAMSFSTPFNPQSGIQVGGYPTMGVPSGASLVWEVTFTNVDSQHRSVTIWPQTELAVGLTGFDGYDIDYIQEHYYIIDGLNPGSTTVNAYTSTTGQYITLAYDVPTTLYFAATQALGSTTQAFGTEVLTPFEAYFAITGVFSDGSLYGETVPYPYGIITQANAYTTPTAGSTGNTVTVSCTSPCHLSDSTTAMVGWINSAGQLTQLTTFTTTASGNIPAGVTFTVPTAAAGYYTIEVTDYTNSVFMTFQHT